MLRSMLLLLAALVDLLVKTEARTVAVADEELSQLLSALPSKGDDANTVTRRFRADLVQFCRQQGRCDTLTVVELGCHKGHTTSILARLFARVFVLDNSAESLAAARMRNRGRHNVIYLRVENYNGLQRFDWPAHLKENDIDIVFVDASHFYPHVASDIRGALSMPQVRTLIFDDYALLAPVRQAVDEYISAGFLDCIGIGEDLAALEGLGGDVLEAQAYWARGAPPMSSDSSIPEGLVCEVRRDTIRDVWKHEDGRDSIPVAHGWEQAILGTHFACHRLAMLGGSATALLEFVISFSVSSLHVLWADATRLSESLPWRASSSFRISVSGEVPAPLTNVLAFESTLRTAFFLVQEEPDVFCAATDDLARLVHWASARIAPSLEP